MDKRQTRSQTKITREALESNLNLGEQAASTTDTFQASIIEPHRGHERDCISCNRRNDAEKYMVECVQCKRWEHFSCAGVSVETVRDIVHRCVLCVPRIPAQPPSSVTDKSTTGSSRRARLARDLERLEEERKLAAETAKANLERETAFLDKKYELLKLQDEDEEKRSVCSRHSGKSIDNRTADWVRIQAESAGATARNQEAGQPSIVSVVEFNQQQSPGLIGELDAAHTSTPLPRQIPTTQSTNRGVNPVSISPLGIADSELDRPSIQRTTGSISINHKDDSESIETTNTSFNVPAQSSKVDIQSMVAMLAEAERITRQTGTVPKPLGKPSLNPWKADVEHQRELRQLQEQHAKENDVRRKREIELTNQLKRLENQRLADVRHMKQVEDQLHRQLQLLEQEKIEQSLRAAAKLEERERELKFLRLSEQRRVAQTVEPIKPTFEFSNDDDERVQYASSSGVELNCDIVGNSRIDVGNLCPPPLNMPSVSNTFVVTPPVQTINKMPNLNYAYCPSTPAGGRTLCPSPTVLPIFSGPTVDPRRSHAFPNASVPVDTTSNAYFHHSASRTTAQQLSARHLSKELPIFSGDPLDWPLFISTYEHSTELCGYSDSENLLRLQHSLKGEAKNSVSSFLMHPSTVPQLIETLRTVYGRPEQIIYQMLNKVRATPAPKDDRMDTLVSFGLVVQNMCSHMTAVGLDRHLSNPMLLQELVDKLPPNVLLKWALYQREVPYVDLGVFGEFMKIITSAVSGVLVSKAPVSKERQRTKEKAFVNTHSSVPDNVSATPSEYEEAHSSSRVFERSDASKSCVSCGANNHHIVSCNVFKNLDINDRWNLVKGRKLCRLCLSSHRRWPCKGPACGVNNCSKRHHRLLHFEASYSNGSHSDHSNPNIAPTENATVTVHREITSSTLFRMLPVTLYGKLGSVDTFAFLDDGSSVTLVEESLANALGADGSTTSLCVQWTEGINKNIHGTRIVSLEISERGSLKRHKLSAAYTLDRLGLPEQTIKFDELVEQFKHLEGLPVQSFKSAVPGLLIGLNNIHLLASLKVREGRTGDPIATKTRIGWAVYGSLPNSSLVESHRQMHICAKQVDTDLHEFVKRFFSVDSLGIAAAPEVEIPDEKRAKHILKTTTKKRSDGHYEVALLWKYDYIELPDSRPMAEKRLKCLERRLQRNPDLYANVCQQINNYQLKGYAHIATEEEQKRFDIRRTWYLPLGVVLNPKKPGKVRLIWDAAAKVDGISLNTMLLTGPDLLSSLLGILFRYREREVAISGDIREMFHQMVVREEDRSAQLFLWRNNPKEPIKTMVMDVAIFGATCSPTHSQYVKNLNAAEHSTQYPRAAEAIIDSHYMDDYLQSVHTVEEAVQLASEVTEVHSKAGFDIVNWMSSNPKVLAEIGAINPSAVKNLRFDKESTGERLLGMVWKPESDVFKFALNFRDDVTKLVDDGYIPTKRQILSVVMSIYDPLGLVATFVIHGKILIQDVWRTKTGWDEKVPTNIQDQWRLWLAVLSKLEGVQINRCYFPGYTITSLDNIQLHIFVDASEKAYAAVAYFRIVDRGTIRCTLVSSKTKVAPLELHSMPRMELLAAVIGARLKKTIIQEHSLHIAKTFMWSDSSTVLSWIRSDVRRYRQYVAFRVNEILNLTTIDEWNWVPTRLNVADEATKWGKGPSFNCDSRWFNAPEYLYTPEGEWPIQERLEPVSEVVQELRPAFVNTHVKKEPLIDLHRFSKWERLLRSIAYVHCFLEFIPQRKRLGTLPKTKLTSEHIKKAERTLWRLAQMDGFPDEVAVFKHNQRTSISTKWPLDKSSSIFNLSPIMDELEVIRQDGRMQAARWMSQDAKYPIILPRNHRITYLLIDWYHRQYRHANEETVVNEIRQRFRVPRLRVQLQLTKKACMWCRVYKSTPKVPRMGPLPRVRLTPLVRPFTFTGIDYFGPYLIKVGRSAVKRWAVLFTCLTVRAIHLEVAASLTTDSCKKAIRRFIARRGAPEEIYSDHGTNFQGARRELREEIKKLNEVLGSTFTDARTQWFFIPPAAPHMGGCWERMVRSVKTALAAIPINDKLDDESLMTFMAEAEHMINSRPLTFIPIRTECEESLTPNHFLMLGSKGVKQGIKEHVEMGKALRGSWNLIQSTLQFFWKKWTVSYLPTITRRTKWFENVRPIQQGELVVLVDENIRNRWLRGRVMQTYPGPDGVARQADILTSKGILKNRPFTKLALLDVGVHAAEPEIQTT